MDKFIIIDRAELNGPFGNWNRDKMFLLHRFVTHYTGTLTVSPLVSS